MDGLTVSTSDQMLQTGKTTSQLRTDKLKAESGVNETGPSFADTLKKAVNEVNTLQKIADTKMQQLATGENKNIPDVLIAAEKADVALKLMVKVRNKIIDAYQEIMKMQV
ncbi:MAG: flagellar hook-basal body complex protein FliE [Bdellovibrionaceae bacterium]|nr:flagellar hook-basal body complex protein FliE [Pseudobdellovibrionaceae bacterium]